MKKGSFALVLAVALLGCHGAPAGSERDAGALPTVTVQTDTVTEIEVPTLLRLSGNLRGYREADVAANATGRVLATSIERGAQVSAGQELARLDVRAAALSAAEASAIAESVRTQEAQARIDCERNDKLKASGAISQAGEVMDSASPALARVRSELRTIHARLTERMNSFLAGTSTD